MSENIVVPSFVTPSVIVAALRAGKLTTPLDRPARQRNEIRLYDGITNSRGTFLFLADDVGYRKVGIPAPAGCEWVQVIHGTPAYHGTVALIRLK